MNWHWHAVEKPHSLMVLCCLQCRLRGARPQGSLLGKWGAWAWVLALLDICCKVLPGFAPDGWADITNFWLACCG